VTYVIGLVALLVALAGIIAYAGDRLGTWVGRRRLSVFGARPRATGQIVGVVVGILIMLTTLGVLALAFQNATQTLVNAQRTADELGHLRVQERVLASQLDALGADLEVARETIASAEADRETAIRERDLAEEQRDVVQAERDELLTEIDETQSRLEALSRQLEEADADLATVEADLAAAAAERDAARLEAQAAEEEAERARLDADRARADADAARAEAEVLGEQVDAVASELEAANQQLLILDVRASEATENVRIALARLEEAERALGEAERARDAALGDRDAATIARDLALADRDAAAGERDAAQAEADQLRATTDALRGQLSDLRVDVAVLQEDAARLAEEAQSLQIDNEGLQARNDQLASGNQDLLAANEALTELNSNLRSQILEGNRNLQDVEQQVVQLRSQLEEEARKLTAALEEFDRTASGNMTFERDQVIFSGAIYANDVASAREELADFVRRASAATASRGAGEVVLTGAQFNSLIEVITETEGSDLVRLISPRNQFSPTQVEVTVEALENTRIFERGRLLVARQIHLGSSELPSTQDEIRSAIAQIKADAVRVVRRSGLDELQAPVYEGVSDESFMNQLLRLAGPAVIGVMTVDAVDRAGPARVELVIVY
jgi:uncharacterized protein (DUF3084 family)